MQKQYKQDATIKKLNASSISTWVQVNISGHTRGNESHTQWTGHRFLIIEHLKLIDVSVSKKLTSYGAFISGKKKKRIRKEPD